jgi:hypothetical protein
LLIGAVLAGAVGLAVPANAAAALRASPPPSGLSAYGRLAWNFEGLLRSTLGSAYACEQTSPSYTFNFTRQACDLAQANRISWQPIFAPHSASLFTLSTSAPPDLGNVGVIRIAGRWVRCGAGNAWLIITGGGSMLCNTP